MIFITGTDTGVGKTVLTALLLSHLRQTGIRAFALKPFCSGGRGDAELLHSLQEGDLTLDEINPYHFAEPLAPLVAARAQNRQISMDDIVRRIRTIISTPSKIKNRESKIENTTLLVEGAGGLLAPLGEGYTLVDLIRGIARIETVKAETLIVAPNRLGTINHTLLTIRALFGSLERGGPMPFFSKVVPAKRVKKLHRNHSLKVVLMDTLSPQHSTPDTRSNPSILTELLSPIPLFRIPYLRKNPGKPALIQQFAKKNKKTLANILA